MNLEAVGVLFHDPQSLMAGPETLCILLDTLMRLVVDFESVGSFRPELGGWC